MQITTSRSKVVALWIVLVSILLTAATFLLPVVATADNPLATHWRAAAGTMATCLYIGAAIVLLRGLRSFKRELRVAYRLMAFGILSFSLAMTQLIIWGVFDLWESDWAASGSGIIPYVLTAGLIYAGARKLAKLLGIRSLYNSFALVVPVSLVVSVAMYFVATALVTYNIDGAQAYIAAGSLCSTYLFCAAVLAYKIHRKIGAYYKSAMWWLFVGLSGLFAAAAHESISTIWFNNGSVYDDYGYYLIPWVISGLLFVYAGYKFRLLPTASAVESAEKVDASSARPADYVDSVVAVAGLVSQPADIDAVLDEFRGITSHVQGGQTSLTDEDKKRLIDAYLQLETYLGNKDPLRAFTKEEVRTYVTPAFRAVLGDS